VLRTYSPARAPLLALLLSVPPLASALAQENPPELTAPPTWNVRLDRPTEESVEDIWYVDMPPGWHITTGPAAVFWDPVNSTSGEYRVESEIFLFDPKGRREGFGVFFGGRNLEAERQTYVYFLLREGGEYLVKSRNGDHTEILIPWTFHSAIASWADRDPDDATARNVLAVEVAADEVRFSVNDVEVGQERSGRGGGRR
jgi:hypothetical protein